MGFVIAARLRYQHYDTGVTQQIPFEKRLGCIPPQMSPALTAPPACRGRRCFKGIVGSDAPLF
jgi:hypothetical protein